MVLVRTGVTEIERKSAWYFVGLVLGIMEGGMDATTDMEIWLYCH